MSVYVSSPEFKLPCTDPEALAVYCFASLEMNKRVQIKRRPFFCANVVYNNKYGLDSIPGHEDLKELCFKAKEIMDHNIWLLDGVDLQKFSSIPWLLQWRKKKQLAHLKQKDIVLLSKQCYEEMDQIKVTDNAVEALLFGFLAPHVYFPNFQIEQYPKLCSQVMETSKKLFSLPQDPSFPLFYVIQNVCFLGLGLAFSQFLFSREQKKVENVLKIIKSRD